MMGPTSGAKNSRIQSVVKHFESFSIHQSGKNKWEQTVDPHRSEASVEVPKYLTLIKSCAKMVGIRHSGNQAAIVENNARTWFGETCFCSC